VRTMAVLTAADLLVAWESARGLPPVRRPAALLHALGYDQPASAGRRDAALLEIHAENFGSCLEGRASCLVCGTDVEIRMPIAEVTAGAPEPETVAPFEIDGEIIHWRLPDEEDLIASARAGSAEQGALLLLSRCIVGDRNDLGPSGRALLAARIAAADPMADITFSLSCPDCGHVWEADVDVAEFVWAGLAAKARRILGEVDELARAYGGAEADIWALWEARRDSFLNLVRHGCPLHPPCRTGSGRRHPARTAAAHAVRAA